MKNLLSINNYYYHRGGAEAIFLEHNKLFEKYRWRVVPFCMKHPENVKTPWEKYFASEIEFGNHYSLAQKFLFATKVIYSLEARNKIEELLKNIRVDICHCHNIYHHLSPSILPKIKSYGIPVVMTLHDLKLACPNYQMMTHGAICERCRGKKYYNVLIHRCIKNSFPLSALIMAESYIHHFFNIYENYVDKFIVPSLFFKHKLNKWGLNINKMVHIPNFIDVEQYIPDFNHGKKFLYFGRLSREKGLMTLIKAAKLANVTIMIAGTGPERSNLENLANQIGAQVEFLGFLCGNRLKNTIKSCRASILPSVVYENAPLSIMESYALGKPVIGAQIGGIPELIKEKETGMTFQSGSIEQLAETLKTLSSMRDHQISQMGKAGRFFVEQNFNKEIYRERCQTLYNSLMH